VLQRRFVANPAVILKGKKIFKVTKFLTYCPLESLSSVPEAEAHEKIFEQSKGCSFGYVSGGDGYLMVPFNQVNLSEDDAAMQAIGQVMHV
jgi:hypothetical protein